MAARSRASVTEPLVLKFTGPILAQPNAPGLSVRIRTADSARPAAEAYAKQRDSGAGQERTALVRNFMRSQLVPSSEKPEANTTIEIKMHWRA